MSRVAIDFGTSNTVLAVLEESATAPETLELEGITRAVETAGTSSPVHLLPTMIHYDEGETLVGQQVLERGLVEHPNTFRWMKRSIAYGVAKRRRTPQGHKSAKDAGTDFLRLLLDYGSDHFSLANDEFVFTAPVEAFEDFRDWLETVARAAGIQRFRLMDEATATVLGHQGAVTADDRFLIFDFGCGTLDVAAVRLDLPEASRNRHDNTRTAVQLGQAGRDIGGMDIDRWLMHDFAARQGLPEDAFRRRQAELLHQAETLKIALSASATQTSTCSVRAEDSGASLETEYRRTCDRCERGQQQTPAMGTTAPACLGCLLLAGGLLKQVRETVERALENAAIKVQLRKDDLTAILVTGGSSLLPAVRTYLEDSFGDKVRHESPFDALVRGACRGFVVPLLQHDYAIESYSKETGAYEFKPLFSIGTKYPTPAAAVKLWAQGSYDGMTQIGIKIFEVSRLHRRTLDHSLIDSAGALVTESRVQSNYHHICLNQRSPTFIVADPPISLQRDRRRFLCSFQVDGNRRLLITVLDNLAGKHLLENHPVVRL